MTHSVYKAVRVKMLPALNGDCFLVSYGEGYNTHVLIDCGFASTYRDHLKKLLQDIHAKGEGLERLIITHIDSDHIAGSIPFLEDSERPFITQIWHNSYRHIQPIESQSPTAFSPQQQYALDNIVRRGYKAANGQVTEKSIGAKQGTALGSLILKNQYKWNEDFGAGAVTVDTKDTVDLAGNATIRLLSPNNEKLDKLEVIWKREIRKLGLHSSQGAVFDDAFEYLLSWEKEPSRRAVQKEISRSNPFVEELVTTVFEEDASVTNGSSIAFVLEIDDKKLLFLADAHPSLIEQNLRQLYPSEQHPVFFDLIKLSHHGSFHNTSPALLKIIDSDTYLFSSNGNKHNHPDKETIAQVIHRSTEKERKLLFNYRTEASEFFDRPPLKQQYNYSIHYPTGDGVMEIYL